MAFSYRLVCAACEGFEPERARSRGNAQRFPAQRARRREAPQRGAGGAAARIDPSPPHIKPKSLLRSKSAHKRQLFAKNKEK